MARYTGPKNKLARKIGEDLGLKTNALKVARRLMIRPGQHGARGRRKLSDYGVQLKAKQKVKYLYGILEKQLRRAYEEASRSETSTGATMLHLLERRLDNVVYRLHWAPTRAAARQLVSHAHVKVNNKRVDIPSYRVKVDDIISLNARVMKIPLIIQLLKDEPKASVDWLDKKKAVAKVKRLPMREDIAEMINEQLVVEHYSR